MNRSLLPFETDKNEIEEENKKQREKLNLLSIPIYILAGSMFFFFSTKLGFKIRNANN